MGFFISGNTCGGLYFRAASSETSISSDRPRPGASLATTTDLVHVSKHKSVVNNEHSPGSGKRCQDGTTAGRPGRHNASQPSRTVHPGSSRPAVSLVAVSAAPVGPPAAAPGSGTVTAAHSLAHGSAEPPPVPVAVQPADPQTRLTDRKSSLAH